MRFAPEVAVYLCHGVLRQCMFCRCYRHDRDPTRWDAVPEFDLSPPAPVSHSLCRACAHLFYPGSMAD